MTARLLNRYIASFMASESYETKSAIVYKIDNVWQQDFRLKYHADWNKLKAVIDKIAGLHPDQAREITEMSVTVDIKVAHVRVGEWCKNLYHENQNCTTGKSGADGAV